MYSAIYNCWNMRCPAMLLSFSNPAMLFSFWLSYTANTEWKTYLWRHEWTHPTKRCAHSERFQHKCRKHFHIFWSIGLSIKTEGLWRTYGNIRLQFPAWVSTYISTMNCGKLNKSLLRCSWVTKHCFEIWSYIMEKGHPNKQYVFCRRCWYIFWLTSMISDPSFNI